MTADEVIVWTAVADWFGKLGYWFECGEGLELQDRLFRLPAVATRLPSSRCDWLPQVGLLGQWPRPSPLVGYRLGLMRARVCRQPRPTMNELLALASSAPGKVRMLRVVR